MFVARLMTTGARRFTVAPALSAAISARHRASGPICGREGIPSFFYTLGLFSPERVAAAKREGGPPLPSNHSALYYPVPEPTLKTGVLTMSMAALNLLGK